MAFRNADDYLRAEHPGLYNYCNPRILLPASATLVDAGVWYPLTGATWTHEHLVGFTALSNGILTYIGVDEVFQLVAIANLTVTKEDIIHMGMFIDDVLRLDTLQLFDVQNKTGTITETDTGSFLTGEVIDFRIMSEAGGQGVDFTSLKLTFK